MASIIERWDMKDRRAELRQEVLALARIERAFRFAGNDLLADGYREQAMEVNRLVLELDHALDGYAIRRNARAERIAVRKAERSYLKEHDYRHPEYWKYDGEPIVDLFAL